MPGSARAAASNARAHSGASLRSPSVAATAASADAAASARALLALIDVLRRLRREHVGVETHRRFGEVALLPRLRRRERRAARYERADRDEECGEKEPRR